MYERVCDLREKRLDEEELVSDFTKTIDVLKKEKEALAKKQKLVEQGLAVINQVGGVRRIGQGRGSATTRVGGLLAKRHWPVSCWQGRGPRERGLTRGREGGDQPGGYVGNQRGGGGVPIA
jgi:hypothetical protein